MIKKILLSSSLLLISACSTVIDGQTQPITIETPGAQNALCRVDNGGNRYDAYTGQTINIRRSFNELVVNCKAEANREKTVLVKREANEWVFLNVANGFIPGATYDVLSGGAFEYPDVVTVSFVGMPITAYDVPVYQSNELRANRKNNQGEYMGPTKIETGDDNRLSTMPIKDTIYYNNFNVINNTGDNMGGSVYSRTNSIVPYNPAEENK